MSKSVEREIESSIKEIQNSVSESLNKSARRNFDQTITLNNKIRIRDDPKLSQKAMVADFKRASLVGQEPLPPRKVQQMQQSHSLDDMKNAPQEKPEISKNDVIR